MLSNCKETPSSYVQLGQTSSVLQRPAMSKTEAIATKFDRNFPSDDREKAITWLQDEKSQEFSECSGYNAARKADWEDFSQLLTRVTKIGEDRLNDELLGSIEALFGNKWRSDSHKHAKARHFRSLADYTLKAVKSLMEGKCAWAGQCDEWLLKALAAYARVSVFQFILSRLLLRWKIDCVSPRIKSTQSMLRNV
jgi:hypothetical protein